jgi:hypothetical protein
MLTPHGNEKIGQVLTQTERAMKLGADAETALGFGLGAMAVRLDLDGKLVRSSRDDEDLKKK